MTNALFILFSFMVFLPFAIGAIIEDYIEDLFARGILR